MSPRHTVIGRPSGRPAHAARPGTPGVKVLGVLAGLATLLAVGWLGVGALLKAAGPSTSTPVSASLITVTPSAPSGAHR